MRRTGRDAPDRGRGPRIALGILAPLIAGLLLGVFAPSCGKSEGGKKPSWGSRVRKEAAPSPPRPEPERPAAPDPSPEPPAEPLERPAALLHYPFKPELPLEEAVPDRWYRVDRDGSPVGVLHVQWSLQAEGDRTLLRDETESLNYTHRKIGSMNDIFVTRWRSTTLRGLDGTLVSSRTEVEEGKDWDRRISVFELSAVEGGFAYRSSMLEKQLEKTHRVEETIVLDSESFLVPHVRAGDLKEGVVLAYKTLSGQDGVVHAFEARAKGGRSFPVEGRDTPCLGVEVTHVAVGASHMEYYRSDGLMVAVDDGDRPLSLISELEARRLRRGLESGEYVDFSSPVRDAGLEADDVGLNLVGAFNLRSLRLLAVTKRRPGVPPPPYQASPFQEVVSVEAGEKETRAILVSKAHDADVTAPYPLEVPAGFEKHLEETPLMQISDPKVVAAAKRAVGEAADARAAAEGIAAFVHENLQRGDSGTIGQYSAVEILSNGYGDCSEHALLFVALCRAAGIPARQVSGYVCLGRSWGNHAWAEIWVGAWIGADPCTRDIGTRARYIFFGYDDEPYGKGGLVSRAFTGHTALRLLEGRFGDGEPVDLTGKEPLFGRAEDGTAFNLVAGVAVKKGREDWRTYSSLTETALTVQGRGIYATVQVQPDQGNRDMGKLFGGGWGRRARAVVQGYPAMRTSFSRGGNSIFFVNADRRLIRIDVNLTAGSREEDEREWNAFFRSLDLGAWKGRPVKTPEVIPPFSLDADGEKAAPEEEPDDGGPFPEDEPEPEEEPGDSGEEDAGEGE